MEKLPLSELTTTIAIAEPGSNQMRSFFNVAAGFQLVYSPDTHLVHISKAVGGKARTRSIFVGLVRDMELAPPQEAKATKQQNQAQSQQAQGNEGLAR